MICLIPSFLVLFSHLRTPKSLQPIEYFVIIVSVFLFIFYREYTANSIPCTSPPRSEIPLPQMQELNLNEVFPIVPQSHSLSEHSLPIIRISPSRIDSSLHIPSTNLSFSHKYCSSPSLPSVSRKNSPSKVPHSNLGNFSKERFIKHRDDFVEFNQKIQEEASFGEGLAEVNEKVDQLSSNMKSYNTQLKSHKEEVKKQPVIPGAKTRIVVEPDEVSYQKEIVEKCELFKKSLEESKKKIDKDLATNIKGIVSQITSDIDDQAHLAGRIQAMLDLLKLLDPDTLKVAIYVLCESMVTRGLDQADSIDLGANFSLNYTKFILAIAKSYRQVHEIYYIAIISRKYLFYPFINEKNVEEIFKRSELKDFASDGRLGDSDKDRLVRSLDTCRAIGFLVGSLFASKDSNFNEGDIWRYLVYILNLKIEFVDRAFMPFLLGFLKSAAGRLRIAYGRQFVKVFELLNGDYVECLIKKFGNNPYLKAYITQLRELLNKTKQEIHSN